MDDLLQAVIAYFEDWLAMSDTGKGNLEDIVAELKKLGEPQAVTAKLSPVVKDWLVPALEAESAPHCDPLRAVIKANYQQISWAGSPASYMGDEYHNKSAFMQLVGPQIHDDGREIPYASDTVATGFLLLAPDLFYPPHYHKAIEFYGVLSGLAEWQVYYNRPDFHPPGAQIFHPSEAPHAMQTHDEPLLLIFAWTGELDRPINMGVEGWL